MIWPRMRAAAGARLRLLRRRGPAYLIYLLTHVYLPKCLYRFWHLRLESADISAVPAAAGSVLSDSQISGLAAEIDRLHVAGVTGFDISDKNVDVSEADDQVSLRHFHGITLHPTRTTAFALARDRDRIKFNAAYGRHLMTETSARNALRSARSRANSEAPLSEWYGAIDFGHGLTVGQVWSTDTGTGRWDYLNARVITPLVAGRRVLDLGSNNGVQPILMLRAGARGVVGIEYSPDHVETAKIVHEVFEWRDLRSYAFTLHNWNMLAILTEELGSFDVVTALCSLYYLTAEDMARVVRRSADLAPVMVVQANVESAPSQAIEPSGTSRSSVEFLRELLVANGFPNAEVHAPAGFSRPLLVGRR